MSMGVPTSAAPTSLPPRRQCAQLCAGPLSRSRPTGSGRCVLVLDSVPHLDESVLRQAFPRAKQSALVGPFRVDPPATIPQVAGDAAGHHPTSTVAITRAAGRGFPAGEFNDELQFLVANGLLDLLRLRHLLRGVADEQRHPAEQDDHPGQPQQAVGDSRGPAHSTGRRS